MFTSTGTRDSFGRGQDASLELFGLGNFNQGLSVLRFSCVDLVQRPDRHHLHGIGSDCGTSIPYI